jgi:uncharacterized membrane protein YedE/YeeE
MTIAWTAFTPWASLAGGLLVGVAAAMLILFNGRIAGISGIVGGLLRPVRGDVGWRAAFVAGLLAAPLAWLAIAAAPRLHVAASVPALVAAGLLVGVGTRLGSGCTSGHGVCGISRGSLRSLAATATFMGAGFAVVFVVRHVLGT